MQPDPSSAKAVKSWLTKNGIHAKTSPGHGDWLTFSTTVGKANTLFNAKFETFHHADTGKKVVRSLSYSIPAHLKPHIAVAHPMVSFPNPYHGKTARASFTAPIPKRRAGSRMPLSRRDGDVSCGDAITPQCLQDIYGIPTAPANASGNSITVTGYGDQFAQDIDLQVRRFVLRAFGDKLLTLTRYFRNSCKRSARTWTTPPPSLCRLPTEERTLSSRTPTTTA
jgi:tripeptidyl-peptidase-1